LINSYKPLSFAHLNGDWLALEQLHVHNKSSEVCINKWSPPVSLPFRGQVTEQTTVKWSIGMLTKLSTRWGSGRCSAQLILVFVAQRD